jgi:hypothetical protein
VYFILSGEIGVKKIEKKRNRHPCLPIRNFCGWIYHWSFVFHFHALHIVVSPKQPVMNQKSNTHFQTVVEPKDRIRSISRRTPTMCNVELVFGWGAWYRILRPKSKDKLTSNLPVSSEPIAMSSCDTRSLDTRGESSRNHGWQRKMLVRESPTFCKGACKMAANTNFQRKRILSHQSRAWANDLLEHSE